MIAFAAASVAGVIDELIQAVLPSRVFDVRDMGFNVLAVTMAIAASALLRQVRRRAQRG